MANNLYTTKTASLKATRADIRNLETKTIKVNGKDVVTSVKHSDDTREVITENDLWGQYIETLEDGTVIVHDDEVTNPNENNDDITLKGCNKDITKVEDNKAYIGDTFYGNIQLEKMKDGGYTFCYCEQLASFAGDLSSLISGGVMFYNCNKLTSLTVELSSLVNGSNMFRNCSNLESLLAQPYPVSSDPEGITIDLSSLLSGHCMFQDCSNLKTFSGNLDSLKIGSYMFYKCSKLASFTSDLSSLTNSYYMFSVCDELTNFSADLSSLVYGEFMFQSCSKLTNFTSDLSSLIDGRLMFSQCRNLTNFTADLSSLVVGNSMFSYSKLNPQSVMYIVESINDIAAEKKLYQNGIIPYATLADSNYCSAKGFMSDGKYLFTWDNLRTHTTTVSTLYIGKLQIGINVINDSATVADQLQAFAEEATFDSWEDLKQAFVDKGWNVTWNYAGSSESIPNTYDIRGNRAIPCPIYAQLIEVGAEDKDRAEYTNEDGSKFYDIMWGHDVTNYDDFQQFDSLEDAMVAYGVIIKQTEEETV